MEPKSDAITATIGIFSGRPNPQLLLTGVLAEEFAGLVSATLGKEPIHPPPAAKLGFYYGFVVQVPGELARRLGLAEQLNVYHGVVTEGKGREQSHWRDVANVERFLIEESYRQGRGELLQRVGIERPK